MSEFNSIVSIGGKPGLYKVISASRSGFIIESIETNPKRTSIPSTSKVAAMTDISIYTTDDENVKLLTIFQAFQQQSQGAVPTENDDVQVLRNALATVVPNYDTERVYASDLKKLFKWYAILSPILDFSTIETPTEAEEGES